MRYNSFHAIISTKWKHECEADIVQNICQVIAHNERGHSKKGKEG